MTPTHSFMLFLSVIFTHLCSLVLAVPWVVTDYYEQAVVTEDYYYTSRVVTTIQQISPTATSLPEAISTITSISSENYYGDATVIQKLLPTGVGRPVDDPYYYNYNESDDYHATAFKVNLTYSAPTGCSTQWTQVTAVSVDPPLAVRDLLPRTAVETSVTVDTRSPFQPTTYTYDVVYVDPTQIPSSTLSSLSYYNRPTSRYTGSECYYTSTYGSSSGSSYYYYDDDYNWFLDSYWIGISPLALTLILTLGWIGLFLILGFIEAFIRFRRLMTGWQTRRGLPVCWSITVLPVSLLLLFFFRKGYRARSQADAEILKKRWDEMGFGTKLRLFFVWGFRFKYPPMLGPAPARVKTSKQPGKNPGPRLLASSPSSSVAPTPRQGSTTGPNIADPEMAEASPASLQPPSQATAPPSTPPGVLPSH
ncbi:hypothetical protein BDV26DRAFT_265209 [Aspergillus bertholletiae]|uniref:Uncharacterized protein n=1 Tax=Aspergillus bertholletiae TaxID=1226010 RepID=A0A5N7B603_9EURO|nr:hypothetical protein BDV26DRAFT_265209 [Aspergillus bertholletiae]